MTRTVARLAACALLLLMFARMLSAATQLSPVVDEQSHISRGLSVLRTGDLRLRIGHPIGLNAWVALPLVFDSGVQLPLDHESWSNAAWDRFGEQFLWRVNSNPDGIVFRARAMIALLTIALGALVYRWAGELYGAQAALLALALVTLDPNLLAHGALATTDLGVTLFAFAALYALWRALRGRRRGWTIAAGILTGLALLSKYSGLFLVPTLLVVVLMHNRQSRTRVSASLRFFAVVLTAALLTVAVVYLFRFDLYLAEFNFLLANTETHPSFLLGQRSIEGWWYYFLVTFMLKTPLPTLLLILFGAVRGASSRGDPDRIFLVVSVLLYSLFSLASGFNVGYRHLLPALPFLFVYASQIVRLRLPYCSSSFLLHPSSLSIGLLVVWLAVSSLAAHPDYIAYFNEAAPTPHYDVLIDSNLDWGQSLKKLRAYLDASRIDRVKLSYFGTADPAAYGIAYDPLPRWPPPEKVDFVPANPAPGVYAISAGNLQGVLLDDPSAFDWFHRRSPDAIVGGSILVYHVRADPDPPQAVGLCRVPWTPIEESAVGTIFGRAGLRQVRFDCADAWWQPDAPAWYILPPDVDLGRAGAIEYERRRRDDSPVYRVSRRASPGTVSDPLDTPARFDGGLTLLGFNDLPELNVTRAFTIETVWRVDAPVRPPVSIFAHLLDANGAFVAGADGFGLPAERLRAGDVIAQRHRLALSREFAAGAYAIEVGFYRLDTGERYAVLVDGAPADRRVLTHAFQVED